QAHLHCTERILQLAIPAVALVFQPLAFRAPEDISFRFPGIFTSPAEAESLEAHRFQCDVSGENHEVSPGDLAAIFLLNRPQQPARLVKVDVIRPAVQRCKALLPGAGPAAAVTDAIRARAVPRHTYQQRP